jgi:hypothetical protein
MICVPPEPLPRVQPTAHELLCVIALLLAERDALKTLLGRPSKQEGRIECSRAKLDEGRQLGPVSYLGDEGQVVVRCDL